MCKIEGCEKPASRQFCVLHGGEDHARLRTVKVPQIRVVSVRDMVSPNVSMMDVPRRMSVRATARPMEVVIHANTLVVKLLYTRTDFVQSMVASISVNTVRGVPRTTKAGGSARPMAAGIAAK